MELLILPQSFTVCKINSIQEVDFSSTFIFLSKTDDEISLVCESCNVPRGAVLSEPGWTAFKISGILDFGMIGVIAGISGILAQGGISLFVISTYNTDYLMIKDENSEAAAELLRENGYIVEKTLGKELY